MAYNKKKYIRINWKNRPSTATALGATNLNHMDAFLNDVDNALIEMDSGKLNVETANSMIASITFDKDKGLMTVRELNGTTYTYDWNVEKIPVSFSLSEDGILTMTTQDGTQFTANIADLIKDYVFDDSDTIAFTKEFQTEDNSYHVGASVKNGSIKAEHLDPDYRTDIQNFSNVAQTAANDALTYSKDSKRWAVGDASYEGSETDNSKYYKEQAENARDAAEKARDEAQAATGAVIMAPGVLGVGKPDNTTIKVTEDGTMSVPKATSDSYGLVKPDNTTIGQEDGAIRLIAKAASLLVTDTQGFVGDKNSETNVQLLIDAIADKMVKQLVSNSALTQQLANYVAKSMMSNIQVNDTDKVPTSALAYAMQQAITANANGITQLNNNFQLTDNATRFVAGSSEKSKAYLRTFDVSGRLFQLALSESGLLFSGYNGDYGSSGKTLWEGVTKSDLDNKIQCGLSSIGEISPGESTSEITFPHSFPTAPKSVVGNIRYVGYGDSLSMQIAGITTTGFSVYIHNTSSRKVSIAIYWIACLN